MPRRAAVQAVKTRTSFDALLRQMIREEVARALEPVVSMVNTLRSQTSATALLAGSLAGMKRGPGRPRVHPVSSPRASVAPGRRGRPRAEARLCAVIGCAHPARSMGYCANHYQKLRNLQKTHRAPSDWREHAQPQSVKNVELPRGRAASKR